MNISYLDKKLALRLFVLILLDVFLVSCSLLFLPEQIINQYLSLIFIINGFFIIFTIYLLITLSNRYIKVRKGELNVQSLLKNELPQAYVCFHDVQLENGIQIDFIVIGPTGIWTLEVKSSHGQGAYTIEQLKSDSRVSYIKLNQSLTQAIKLKEFLKTKLGREFPVMPVSIFSKHKKTLEFDLNKINGVYIVEISQATILITSPQFGYILPEANKTEILNLFNPGNKI